MQKIFSIADLQNNVSKTTDAIVIPEYIFGTLLGLCKDNVENSGYLILNDNRIVEYPFLSGSGNAGSVFPQKKITFPSSDYSTVEFHIHPELLGDFWASNFSEGDLNTFNNRIKQEGENYTHVLFTPKNVLTWGYKEAPNIRIGFKETDYVMNLFKKWNDKYNQWDVPPQELLST